MTRLGDFLDFGPLLSGHTDLGLQEETDDQVIVS